MSFAHFALFIIFIEHQFKKVLKQKFILFLFNYDHALHIEFISWKKRKKNDSTIEREKYEYPS